MAAVTATILQGSIVARNLQRDVYGIKCLTVETANTVDSGDTFTVDLANYSGSTFLGVSGCKHTTDNSVVVVENPTTSVSSTTITFTVPAGSDDDKRVAKIYFI